MTSVEAAGFVRCAWPGLATDPLYQAYHDTEWGVPVHDDRRLLEKLILEGFQAGLSWLTILRKREAFRAAFDGFDPERMVRYGERDIARLMAEPGIVRSRAKIEAAIGNARAYLAVLEASTVVTTSSGTNDGTNEGPLAAMLWGLLPSGPVTNHFSAHGDVPASTPVSVAMAKLLKARGFRFVGPTTAYAFMQSVGMVNDHLTACHRHGPCAAPEAFPGLPASLLAFFCEN
ncbi:MAG: DNA-3-methyladenine glycosylase I, partial [Hyphomicrobiaceae bacterium]|nr:DNA-3-methyladenine glycosylase I [Hyphomicrobiaceae bacterium]